MYEGVLWYPRHYAMIGVDPHLALSGVGRGDGHPAMFAEVGGRIKAPAAHEGSEDPEI